MSYVAEAAIAVQERGAAASRGWFRVDPGQCRSVLQGALTADEIFIHTRVNAVYGPPPAAQTGDADFCVADGNFVIGGARYCRGGQRSVRFSAVKPSDSGDGSVIMLAEAAEYDDTQARDAGIQRLLVAAGYDASPVDGLRGEKTDAALRQFLIDNKLSPTAAGRSDFFDVLLDAAQKPGNVFTWCNDTSNTVMAAIGIEDRGLVVTRGWYRVEAGKCLRPDVTGQPKKLYSFAEAVDADGRAILQGGKPLTWGGDATMCTRSFQIRNRRSGRLRRQGFDRGRIRCHRSCGAQPGDGPIQVMSSFCKARAPRHAASPISRPGSSISTTRSIRITSISGSRSTSASATTSPIS